MFRLPIRKGEKWSAKVWAFKALNSGIAGMKSPTTVAPPNPPQKGGLKTGLLLVTPIIIPNLGNQSTENQGLSFNVLAAVPIVKSIFKGLKPVKAPKLKLPEIAIEDADFVTESTGTAYLLVELLDEKNNVINPEVAKLYVNSQGIWEPLATEKTVDFGNECTQAGILRFSLVNDTDYNVWFDDFEITHKQSDEKINITSWTDYYPYGKVAKTSCSGAGAYRYGYQGEFAEKEEEWNSFELRQYDSEIGRWLSTDPYGQHWSPYMAMGNDPACRIDADGGWDCDDDCIIKPPGFWERVGNWFSGNSEAGLDLTITWRPIEIPAPNISVPPVVASFALRASVYMSLLTLRGDDSPTQHKAKDEVRPVAVPVTDVKVKDKDDGSIRVRHYTSKDYLKKIIAMNAITTGGKGTPWGVDVELPPFGLVSTAQQDLMTQGSAYVEFSIHRLRIIPIPGTGTATHPNRHTGRIPLGLTGRAAMANPLMLHDKMPRFVGAEWWRFW